MLSRNISRQCFRPAGQITYAALFSTTSGHCKKSIGNKSVMKDINLRSQRTEYNRTSLVRQVFHEPEEFPDRDLLNFRPFRYEPANDVKIHFQPDASTPVTTLSLKEIIEKHIRVGQFLTPLQAENNKKWDGVYTISTVSDPWTLPPDLRNYVKSPFYEDETEIKIKSLMLRVSTHVSPRHHINFMSAAYYGLRRNMWMHFIVGMKLSPGMAQEKAIPRMGQLERTVHLRPDVLLPALPEKTGLVISPQMANAGVQFLLAPAVEELDPSGEVVRRQPEDQTARLIERQERTRGMRHYVDFKVQGGDITNIKNKRLKEARARGFGSWEAMQKEMVQKRER